MSVENRTVWVGQRRRSGGVAGPWFDKARPGPARQGRPGRGKAGVAKQGGTWMDLIGRSRAGGAG